MTQPLDHQAVVTALVVVDVQNDFCEGGSLAVSGGSEVARRVAEHVLSGHAASGDEYDHVVATADWHIDPGTHWARDGVEPDFVESWPVHCEAGTPGAQWHPNLSPAVSSFDAVFRKGEYAAAYSGFEGSAEGGVGLADWLRSRGVTDVDVVGIATDYCVRATALDAASAGFTTRVLVDLTAGVAEGSTAAALDEMAGQGISLHGLPAA